MHTPTVQLMDHQARAVELMARHPRFGFWLDCGTGKTISMLAGLDASRAVRDIAGDALAVFPEADAAVHFDHVSRGDPAVSAPPYIKTVVVCPKAIMRNAWERDAEHFPGLTLRVCWANTPAKRRALIVDSDGVDVLVINFELFKKHRRDIWDAGVRRLIVDESSKMKSHDTQITKDLIEFADYMESVYLLSGTPAPNSGVEYWAQFRAIDKAVFGDSFYRFAAEYFSPIKKYVHGKTIVVGHRPKPQYQGQFLKRMRARSWSLRKDQALDLPEQVDVLHRVELTPKERAAYDQAEDALRVELGGDTLSVRAEALVGKLRQLCGGWMYHEGESRSFGRSKLDALNELLDSIGRQPCVVWIDYREDAERVRALIEKRGERVAVLDGSFSGDSSEVVKRFQAGEIERLVCHPASVGHGITLTAASYAVFYTVPWSYELCQQARDRIHRKGQRSVCTYYHLIAEGTIDKAVMWAVKTKGKKADAVMRALGGMAKAG